MVDFYENASLEGGRRAPSRRLPGSNGSLLGGQRSDDRLPHSPPRVAIFIRRGDLKKVMGRFHEIPH